MSRQVRGEGLNIGSVLTWALRYYHRSNSSRASDKTRPPRRTGSFITTSRFRDSRRATPASRPARSQGPGLPGAKRIEEWPTWTLPILQWAARQGAVTGYAHSGWGLAVTDDVVPSLQVPAFDGIGANEYIVDVTHDGAVHFISAVDTPYPWELSIWYHTLNVGFRTGSVARPISRASPTIGWGAAVDVCAPSWPLVRRLLDAVRRGPRTCPTGARTCWTSR